MQFLPQNAPESISESVTFKNFLGGMPPDPPRMGMRKLYMHSYFLVTPPLRNPVSAPEDLCTSTRIIYDSILFTQQG